jgi:hypothetical protein
MVSKRGNPVLFFLLVFFRALLAILVGTLQ